MEAQLAIPLRGIPDGGTRQWALELGADELELRVGEVTFLDPVRVTLDVSRSGDQFHVLGTARVAARQVCARCLEAVTGELVASLEIVGRQRPEREAPSEPPEGILFHDGEVLDVASEVRQGLILEVPVQPLCGPTCAGLCPRCGANLNRGPCGCGGSAAVDPRWRALQQLRHKGPKAEDGRHARED